MKTAEERSRPLSRPALGAALALALAACPQALGDGPQTIDFEGLPRGTIVGAAFGSAGTGPVLVSGFNALLAEGVNAAVVFDSSCQPTGLPASCTGGDPDLGTPHQDFGGPGTGSGGQAGSPFANGLPLGNVLVLALDVIDANGDGLVDDPDDADLPYSPITFDFSLIGHVQVASIRVVDVQPTDDPATIELRDPQGALLALITLPVTGDNGVAFVDLGPTAGVASVVVTLNGAGAVDDLVFESECAGRVGDRLWRDDDGDGLQDPGEPGIAGVRVRLYRNTGISGIPGGGLELVAETWTDASGAYLFNELCAGDYLVEIDQTTLPPGLDESPAVAGGDPEADSDFAAGLAALTLASDDSVDLGVDAGFVPIEGACCLPDGTCAEELLPAACAALGGTFKGAGTTCPTVTCPQPVGACCFLSGGCSSVRALICMISGGAWQGPLTQCAAVDCPQQGACCLDDGSCISTLETACASLGGEWHGEGVPCATISCPLPTGACCLGDGSCAEVTENDCAASAGSWEGPLTQCASADCPQPTGACCFQSGACDPLREVLCMVSGGSWQGAGTACATASCPQPGACCFTSGSCTNVLQAACASTGGAWQGASTVCATANCPQPGACCFTDGSCTNVLQAACATAGGAWQGASTVCATANCPQPGACCLTDGSCTNVLQAACATAGGAWQGASTVCATANCPQPGACCFTDGSCTNVLQTACATAGGAWQGASTVCATANCPQPGACCFTDGSCTNVLQTACTTAGGAWQGASTVCATANCPQPGACCFTDGSCTNVLQAACASTGGAWQGASTVCATANCPQPGACCFTDGSCTNVLQAACASTGGAWQGASTVCATANCPQPGACCRPDGSCLNLLQSACAALGGMWQGAASSCASVACPQPGACCFVNGTCTEVRQIPCITASGTWQGPNTHCAAANCPQPGACCLGDGTCVEVFASICASAAGTWQGPNTLCATTNCPQPGACCLDDGACVEVFSSTCASAAGTWQGASTLCATADCPQPGACCLGDGACVEVLGADCVLLAGTWQGGGGSCATAACPQLCACCLGDGGCVEVLEADCTGSGGAWQGAGTLCATAICPQPGACCLNATTCVQTLEAACTAQGGTWHGASSTCAAVACATVPLPVAGGGGVEKGSLVFFSKFELRWDATGNLLQDTFIELTNDFPEDVMVQLYFVNGDAPLPAAGAERAHPGWNRVDNQTELTGNEPAFWSAATGQPKGLSPLTVLDPGTPPGRPDPDGGPDRVLRGVVLAWAVDSAGAEIRWNHLGGRATILNYQKHTAWEYNGWVFPVVDPAVGNGHLTGTPGVLSLDGAEYARCPSQLLLSFQAAGSAAWTGGGRLVTSDTRLILHPVSTDLRQETGGPVTTKAKFDIWNENEVKFSGAARCVTCWDQVLLSAFIAPNHFLRPHLQSDHGRTRIDGVESQVCDLDFDVVDGLPLGADPRDVVSENAALLGVAVKLLTFDAGGDHAAAGGNLIGMGAEDAVIRYDVLGLPPEAQGDDALEDEVGRINRLLDALLREIHGTGADPHE